MKHYIIIGFMIFNLFGCKEKKVDVNKHEIFIGMILLDNNDFNADKIISTIKEQTKYNIKEITQKQGLIAIDFDEFKYMIGYIPAQIPFSELEPLAKISYLWPEALDNVNNHKTHVIVSILPKHNNRLKILKDFTFYTNEVIKNTNSTGIYISNQRLLVSRQTYLDEANIMSDTNFPLDLWIYFGIVKDENNTLSGYTFGLDYFGKKEIEIIKSDKDFQKVRSVLFDFSHYVIENNIILKDNETIGRTMDEKIPIKISKGEFVDSMTIKIKI
jgi:hypothetical protein